MSLLSTKDLVIGYHSRRKSKVLLKGVNLMAKKGQLIVMIGRNGTGKSTFLKSVAGLHPAYSGRISIDGKDLKQLNTSERARLISIVLTEKVFAGNLNVENIVAMGRFPYTNMLGKLTKNDLTVIENALAITGLENFRYRNVQELSDGELQKVMIARAVAQDTPITLLDEPTAFLDVVNRKEIIKLLRYLVTKTGKTVIFSSHEIEQAIELSDVVWLVKDHTVVPSMGGSDKSKELLRIMSEI